MLNENIDKIVIERKLPFEIESAMKIKEPPKTGRRYMNTSRSLALLPIEDPPDEDEINRHIPYKEVKMKRISDF